MRTKKLSTRLTATLVALGAGSMLAACGDNLGSGDDGGDDDPGIDAGPDSMIDASIDAMEDTFSGTITILEASVLGVPQLGQGIQLATSFSQDGVGPAPVFEETPGSITGCKVWEYTPAETAALIGLAEGPVVFSVDNDNATEGVQGPALPACVFVPTAGYLCPDATQSPGGTLSRVPDQQNPGQCLPGLALLLDTDEPFTFAVTDGRYVSFRNTGVPLLPDGLAVPIVAKVPFQVPNGPLLMNSAIVFPHTHAAFANTTCLIGTDATIPLDPAGLHTTLGGVGPIPPLGAPPQLVNFLHDDAHVTITHTAGGGDNIPDFTVNFAGGATTGPGHAFTLNGANAALLANLPLDGSAFTIECASGTGCGAGSASGTVLNIVTTDGPIAGLSPLTMPPPATKRVQVRCAGLATNSVTVPAAASAYLMSSGATRIQTTFIRGRLGGYNDATTNIIVIAGHAITTFQTPE